MNAPVRIQDHFPVAPEKQTEEVDVILPNTTLVGTFNLLTPLSELEELKISFGVADRPYVTHTLTKKEIAELAVGGILCNASYTQATSTWSCRVDYISDTQLSVVNLDTPSMGIRSAQGKKKRYVTETKQVIIPVNNGNDVIVRARYEILASQLPSDFRNTDGTIKSSVKAKVQLNVTGPVYSGWAEHNKDIFDAGSGNVHIETGVEVDVLESVIAVRTAGNAATGTRNDGIVRTYLSNPWGITTNVVSAPCRVIVWNDEKTAISVPVADKGYGGLRKDTVDTGSLADFTVPNVIDFNLALVGTPLKVTQNVSNNRLSLSQIGIWGSSGSINLTFDSGNNGREIIADIYNETKGQVALEKPEYVARNQLGITIPISVDVLEILTSGDEYALRVHSNDVFTNVKVGKCWWDVTLNAPL